MPCFTPCNRSVLLAACIAYSACAGASAATLDQPFSGRWRLDTASLVGGTKPTTFRLTGGSFRKNSDEVVRADGQLHHVPSDGYVDEMSITVKSGYLVKEVDRIHGKLAYTVDYVVAPNGSTLTWDVVSYTSPSGQPVRTQEVQRRVGPVIKGAHLISGEWKRVGVVVGAKSDWLLKLDQNRFSWRTEAGIGYDAVVGGGSVPIDGDNSGARAVVTRPRPDTIVETDLSAKGQVDDILSMQLMPDQVTIRAIAMMPRIRKTSVFFLHKLGSLHESDPQGASD